MPTINVKVENKIAQAEKGAYIVCGNSDYIINFELGEEWSGHNFKTALFVFNGKLQPVVFEGNSCAVPVLYNTTLVAVGLQSKDKTLITTTPSYIRCEISAEDLGGEIEAPAQDVYDEIIALLNKYIAEGGGSSSGGLTEEQVKQIVSEEIADLQTKTDESLETESKTVVGSINELNNKNNSLSKEIAIANAILEQSGIVSKYKATIEDTYSERITADGANVLDGSKAKLGKVVGNTVACKNLFNVNAITNTATIVNNGDGSISVSAYSTPATQQFGELCPKLKDLIGQTVVFSMNTGESKFIYLYASGGGVTIETNKPFAVEEKMLTARVYWYNTSASSSDTVRISNIQLEVGSVATEYQPYFTGLKTASFGGIESTNADGTETATLDFPKTETPLGVAIDFENKKITDYGVTYEFTGNEQISYSGWWNRNGILIDFSPKIMPQEECAYVCTDTDATKAQDYGFMYFKYGGNFCLWSGILDKLGITTQGTTPTVEEQATAVATFKAWLTQRYAEGNPVTVRYLAEDIQSETPFTADNEYTAYKGGTEKVLDNDGKEYGAENTLSQNYIIVTEIK